MLTSVHYWLSVGVIYTTYAYGVLYNSLFLKQEFSYKLSFEGLLHTVEVATNAN